MSSEANDLQFQLEEVIASYLHACEEGENPDREALMLQYPSLAEELRDFFRHRDRMQALIDPLRSAASRVLNIRCPHCRSSIELAQASQLTQLSCPQCGSDFSLADPDGTAAPRLERIGQFQLVQQVGAGQFGAVWKARDLALERTVAIKIPRRRHMSTSDVEVFLRDARVAAQLKHPNIVSVHEVGKHEGTIYIVSDLIQGASLNDWIVTHPQSFHGIVALCETVARALHYAHQQGVVHRDLKPGNIMMDLAGAPHIVDFGLAKRDVGELTITLDGQLLGTPAYMSPEQARGEGHTAQRGADIYSLGVILFELLTQELPFRGSRTMLLKQIIEDRPPSPRGFNSRIPRDVETICLKCLEKDPSQRYATAQALAEDLHRFLEGKPVSARPVPNTIHALRWCRRNPIVAGLAAAVALLLVAVATVSTAGYFRTQEALDLSNARAETIEQNLYLSEMLRAGQAALSEEGLSEVARLVRQWEPNLTLADRRGWEWHYLKSLLHQELITLQGHATSVTSLQWSPDGKYLASGSADNTAIVWTNNGTILHTLSGHQKAVAGVAWSHSGDRLASCSDDATIRIWDPLTGKILKTIPLEQPMSSIVWTSDDAQIIAVARGNTQLAIPSAAARYDVQTGTCIQHEPSIGKTGEAILTQPGGAMIAAVSEDGNIAMLNSPTFIEQQRIGNKEQNVHHLAWSRDGRQLAFTDVTSGTIQFWDATQPSRFENISVQAVGPLAWDDSSKLLAFTSGNKEVRIKQLGNEDATVQILKGHLSRVTQMCFHPNSKLIATASTDGQIKIWNVDGSDPHLRGSAAIAWSPNGKNYASRLSKTVVIGDATNTSLRPQQIQGHAYDVFDVSWSPNSELVASYSYDREIRIWNVADGKCLHKIKAAFPIEGLRWPEYLSWHMDGQSLAYVYDNTSVRIFDLGTATTTHEIQTNTKIKAIDFNPDSTVLATGGDDAVLRLWDIASGKQLKQIGTPSINNQIVDLDWSPDGTRIVCASAAAGALIWDTRNGDSWLRLSGHTTYVHAVDWSPDGLRIASADDLGSIRIWDANTGHQTIDLAYNAGSGVPDIKWHPDSKTLAAVAYGGFKTIQLWDTTMPDSREEYWQQISQPK